VVGDPVAAVVVAEEHDRACLRVRRGAEGAPHGPAWATCLAQALRISPDRARRTSRAPAAADRSAISILAGAGQPRGHRFPIDPTSATSAATHAPRSVPPPAACLRSTGPAKGVGASSVRTSAAETGPIGRRSPVVLISAAAIGPDWAVETARASATSPAPACRIGQGLVAAIGPHCPVVPIDRESAVVIGRRYQVFPIVPA
jgi:hypothetical protein